MSCVAKPETGISLRCRCRHSLWRHHNSGGGGPIWMKFGRLVLNQIKGMVPKSKLGVEFRYMALVCFTTENIYLYQRGLR